MPHWQQDTSPQQHPLHLPGRYYQLQASISWARQVTWRGPALWVGGQWLSWGWGFGRPLRLREKASLEGCHISHQQCRGLGAVLEVTFVSKQTVTTKGAIVIDRCLQTSREASCLPWPIATMALGRRGNVLLPLTVTFGRLTTGSAGRGRVGGLDRSASSA